MEYYNPNVEEIYNILLTSNNFNSVDDSYFNKFKIITIEAIEKKIIASGYNIVRRKGYNEHQYALNDILLILFMHNSAKNSLGYINIDGCFAAYDKNLEFCYKFIKDINDNIFKVRLFDIYDKEIKTDLASFEDFKKHVKEHYIKDYKNFVERFGEFDELVMADEDFYMLNNAKHSKKSKS